MVSMANSAPLLLEYVKLNQSTEVAYNYTQDSSGVDNGNDESSVMNLAFMVKSIQGSTTASNCYFDLKAYSTSTQRYQARLRIRAYDNTYAQVQVYVNVNGSTDTSAWTNIIVGNMYYFQIKISNQATPSTLMYLWAWVYADLNRSSPVTYAAKTSGSGPYTTNKVYSYIGIEYDNLSEGDSAMVLFGPTTGRFGDAMPYTTAKIIMLSATLYNGYSFLTKHADADGYLRSIYAGTVGQSFFEDIESGESEHTTGSPPTQGSQSGGRYSALQSDLDTIANNFINTFTSPTSAFAEKGLQKPLIKIINSLVNDVLKKFFEHTFKGSIDAFKSSFKSIAWLLDKIHTVVKAYAESTSTSIVTWINTYILTTSLTLMSKVNSIYTIAQDIPGLITTVEGLVSSLATVDGIVDNIKLKTDTISWGDITTIDGIVDSIKSKTDLINWSDIITIDGLIDNIKSKTDTITWSDIITIDGLIDNIKSATDTINWNDITSLISSLANLCNPTWIKNNMMDGLGTGILERLNANTTDTLVRDTLLLFRSWMNKFNVELNEV